MGHGDMLPSTYMSTYSSLCKDAYETLGLLILFFSLPAWSKNYYSSLNVEIIMAYQTFLPVCSCAASRAQQVVTFMVGPNSLEKIRAEPSHHFFCRRMVRRFSKESGN